MARFTRTGFAACLAMLVVVLNLRLHRPGDVDVVGAQLRYLDNALSDGAAERMQQWFPEGFVFTWALYGLAAVQTSEALHRDDARRADLLARAATAQQMVSSRDAKATFVEDLEPRYGAFYASWALYTTAQYIRAAGLDGASPGAVESFRVDCARFAAALSASDTPFLPSYPGAAWPADTAVGVGALGICRDLIAPEYDAVIQSWVTAVRDRLDEDLGAVSHAADSRSGAPLEGVRGSSLASMSRVLVDADPDFAREQYDILRDHFVTYRLGAPGVREYPVGSAGVGDVDSGPLILGYSGPAVVVGAAAARVFGDTEVANVLLGSVEVVGFPVQLFGARRYAAGLVPVGDAFIAWARSTPQRTATPVTRPALFPRGWSLPFHLLSALFLLGVSWRLRSLRRRAATAGRGPCVDA